MSARTTPEERDTIARLLTRLLAERASLAAEVERLRQSAKGEVVSVRYAISHAPKGVKGGPWEARDTHDYGDPTSVRADVFHTEEPPVWTLEIVQKTVPHARIVRFVTRKKAKK